MNLFRIAPKSPWHIITDTSPGTISARCGYVSAKTDSEKVSDCDMDIRQWQYVCQQCLKKPADGQAKYEAGLKHWEETKAVALPRPLCPYCKAYLISRQWNVKNTAGHRQLTNLLQCPRCDRKFNADKFLEQGKAVQPNV